MQCGELLLYSLSSSNSNRKLGMPTVPIYGYGRKVYRHLTGTGTSYLYHKGLLKKAQWYSTVYGTAVKQVYG